jgi:TusA-related sulfurtransferase
MLKPGSADVAPDRRPAQPDALDALGPIAQKWVGAIPGHDFQMIESLFAPRVAFRALVPRGLREGATSTEAIAWIETWFGDTDSAEILATAYGTVADRSWFSYRFHLRKPDGWMVIEQQVYATVVDGRIERLDLLCSGFRPAESTGAEPSTSLNALGADCATLIPTLARKMAAVPAGGVLDIQTDDPTAEPSLASWARLTGHEVVGSQPDPVAGNHWYVRRKES